MDPPPSYDTQPVRPGSAPFPYPAPFPRQPYILPTSTPFVKVVLQMTLPSSTLPKCRIAETYRRPV